MCKLDFDEAGGERDCVVRGAGKGTDGIAQSLPRKGITMATILVVDNDSNQRLLLREAFQQEGHTVLTASNSEEALSAVATTMPHVVVLDIGLPGMDGIELLGRLVSISNRLPVVIYTGLASYRDSFMSWAADAYVLKSSDLTELKQTIRHILGKGSRSLLTYTPQAMLPAPHARQHSAGPPLEQFRA